MSFPCSCSETPCAPGQLTCDCSLVFESNWPGSPSFAEGDLLPTFESSAQKNTIAKMIFNQSTKKLPCMRRETFFHNHPCFSDIFQLEFCILHKPY